MQRNRKSTRGVKRENDWYKQKLIVEAKVTLVVFVIAAFSYLVKYVF